MPDNKSVVSMAAYNANGHDAMSGQSGQQKSVKGPVKKKLKRSAKNRKFRVSFTQTKKDSFLRELAKSCNVLQSAELIGVSVDTVYRHRRLDPSFAAEWAKSIEIAYDELMLEMLRRARFGTEKPIIYGGKQVGVFNDLNDTMAMRLLSMHLANVANYKANAAEHKRDNIMDMTNSDETHRLLMQRLTDIKKRLNAAQEVKSADKAPLKK